MRYRVMALNNFIINDLNNIKGILLLRELLYQKELDLGISNITHIERVSFDIYDLILIKNQIITIYLFLSIIYKIVI